MLKLLKEGELGVTVDESEIYGAKIFKRTLASKLLSDSLFNVRLLGVP